MFQQGLDIAHENVLRCLELMWMKFVDDASHYNHMNGARLTAACILYMPDRTCCLHLIYDYAALTAPVLYTVLCL